MPQAFRHTLVSLRDLLVSAGPLAILTILALILAFWWLNPTPPKQVSLATGPAQSAYETFGKRYQAALAQEGIEVRLQQTDGSSDNLALLREGKVDLAFVQGGTGALQQDDREHLVSLGSLFYEPLWVFYQTQLLVPSKTQASSAPASRPLQSLPQLKGLRLNVGTAGSGLPVLFDSLLEANGMSRADARLSELGPTDAVVKFLAGELDVLVFASAPESLMVQMLLQTPGVALMDFPQNEAYARRFPFLSAVTLPRGVVDLARDIPQDDVRLLASTTALLSRDTTHPALLELFARAGQSLHRDAGWFNRARDFPNTRLSELPIAGEADRAINEPVPLLQRYLPFWAANLVERMWLVLGLLVAALLPLSRIVPPLYQLRVRSRVFRWYGRLRDIEQDIATGAMPADQLAAALDRLETQVEQVKVPLSYADELYALRQHIRLVREKTGNR